MRRGTKSSLIAVWTVLGNGCKTTLLWPFDTQNCGPVDITATFFSQSTPHPLVRNRTPKVLQV